MNASHLALALVGSYLTIGLLLGLVSRQRGAAWPLVASHLAAWPLLLTGGAPSPGRGPYGARIEQELAAARVTLGDPQVAGLVSEVEIEDVERSLRAADLRLALVDRLLTDPGVRGAPEGQRLLEARERAAAEIEAVLRGLVQVRVQLGLVALAGESAPVRARLAELGARVRALDELGLA